MVVLDEVATLDAAISGQSISRYGDGELRLAIGGTSISQRQNSKALQRELCSILADPPKGCLACIPRAVGPNVELWTRYTTNRYAKLFQAERYGSLHITRPDSAPWINTPDYWQKMRSLWAGKDVVLVRGTDRSLHPGLMADAKSIREVNGPRVDAYAEIERMEAEVGTPTETVILCLGAAATCLAARLARKGVHAVDLGHVGMFMRRLGV